LPRLDVPSADMDAGMDADPAEAGEAVRRQQCIDEGAPATATAAAAAGAMQRKAVGAASDDVFRVWLNPNVTASLPPGDVDALQREFADWFPGPVLLPVGTEVRLIPQQDTKYRNLVGAVREHLAMDPRIVKVDLPATEDAEEETVSVLYSILRLGKNAAETMAREKEQSREMQERTTQLLSESHAAGAGARFTVIG
jgi:hypothetical protein